MSNRNNDTKGPACICLYLGFFLLIFYVYGIRLWKVENSRVSRINEYLYYMHLLVNRYNYRAKQWIDQGITAFKNVSFRLNKETVFSENTERFGTFYPVRDSCNKKDDPQEQCVLTDALFYHATVSLSGDYINVTITNENSVIIDTQYPRGMKRAYTMADFNCDGKYSYMILRSSNRKDCQKKCQENNGVQLNLHAQFNST